MIVYTIWRDSFIYHKDNHAKLHAIRKEVRKMRNKHKRVYDSEIDLAGPSND